MTSIYSATYSSKHTSCRYDNIYNDGDIEIIAHWINAKKNYKYNYKEYTHYY